MKLVIALVMAASLMACGKSKKPDTTPTNTTGTTETKTTDGATGGQTYGGGTMTPPAGGADPCAGQ
jgi:hypothetical protein